MKNKQKKGISTCCFDYSFFIETAHGANLEFVLEDVSKRTGKDYMNALWDILDAEGVKVFEDNRYGSICVTIRCNTLRELREATKKVKKGVAFWVDKYNINSMKGDSA